MADFKDKISNIVKHQAPDFVLDDHPYFLEYVKEYYKFLESAEITLSSIIILKFLTPRSIPCMLKYIYWYPKCTSWV